MTANQLMGWNYDGAGNLLSDTYGNVYTYDAEGQNTGARLSSGGSVSYVYDADGQRIEKDYGSTVTDTIFFGGQPIARYSGGAWTDLVYGASGLLAEVPGSQAGVPSYRLTDHLGSVVATVPSSGAIVDYAPFGQIISGSTSDPYKFTGNERDTESSGLDYFGARYYSSSMGRWTSPDRSVLDFADLTNPQSLNLYSYVLNNPLKFTDIDGLVCHWDDGTQNDSPSDGGASYGDCVTQGGTWREDVTVNVSADDNGNQLDVTQTDSNGTFIDFLPGAGCSAALVGANKNAQAISNYYRQYQGVVAGAANAHGIDTNLLAAVGVRESGFRNSIQPGGAGRGIFQIDLGQHPNVSFSQAMDPSYSANYAAGILQSGYASAASLGYSHDMSNAGAARQYNAGPRYFKQKMTGGVAALDKGTAGANHGPGNYVSNVLALSTQCF